MKNNYNINIDPIEPEIGMGATTGVGSDCYPYTIVGMNDKKTKIIVQKDLVEKAEGYDYYSNQVYTYIPDPNASKRTFTLRHNGYWVEMNGYQHLSVGVRRAYQDPSF